MNLSSIFGRFNGLFSRGALWLRAIASILLIYILILLILSFYWSREPDLLLPNEFTVDLAAATSTYMATPLSPQTTGSTTTTSLIFATNTLLEKPGGYLSNDVFPPGVYLDNIPNWEFGVLVQVRDLSKAMREAFSRSQSQSTEDPNLIEAEPNFNFNSEKWFLPSTESTYREGLEHLDEYHTRLVNPTERGAQFYARADNLRFWLGSVEKRLGSLSQRLSASVGQRRINTDLAGDADATQSTPTANEMVVKTPWLQIDDVFYEARGTTWALVHFLRAVEVDFADVLQRKNALVSLQQIIRELEATQENIYSPMVMNGGGFGMFANHSLVMASYISRAHTAILDLRELLSQG